MKSLIFSITVALFSTYSNAQEIFARAEVIKEEGKVNHDSKGQETTFEFFDFSLDRDETIDLTKVGNHFLGKEIAYQFQLIEKLYTFKTPIGPGNPGTKMVIQKPDIYNCIHKINKSLKKQLKKGQISENKARKEMKHYLAVAIAVISQDTEEFEAAIKSAKEIEAQIKIFKNTRLRTI